jgi:SPRY domain
MCGSIPYEPLICDKCGCIIGASCAQSIGKICDACNQKGNLVLSMGVKKLLRELNVYHIVCKKTFLFEQYSKHLLTCHSEAPILCQNTLCKKPVDDEPYITQSKETKVACSANCCAQIELQDLFIAKYGHDSASVFGKLKEVLDETSSNWHNIMEQVVVASRCEFKWNSQFCQEIKLDETGKKASINEELFIFHSTVADKSFTMPGRYYWEIHLDNTTENEMKVGVTAGISFSHATSFSDYKEGMGYFGAGEIRNANNVVGSLYGTPFRNQGVIGVLLDILKGELSFYMNGKYLGIAFKSSMLMKCPIWPAISMLHHTSCTLVTGLVAP